MRLHRLVPAQAMPPLAAVMTVLKSMTVVKLIAVKLTMLDEYMCYEMYLFGLLLQYSKATYWHQGY